METGPADEGAHAQLIKRSGEGAGGAFLTAWQLPDLLIVLLFDLTRGDKRRP